VAEEAERPEEGAASTDRDVHPAAISIALNGASRGRADAFLDKQIHLADLQIQNLQKFDAFGASHLRWRRFNDQMKGAVQFILLALGLLIVGALGAAFWNAANDRGLVIEAFSVPPDLAARGSQARLSPTRFWIGSQTFRLRPFRRAVPRAMPTIGATTSRYKFPTLACRSVSSIAPCINGWVTKRTSLEMSIA
jgi:hypothetical protein